MHYGSLEERPESHSAPLAEPGPGGATSCQDVMREMWSACLDDGSTCSRPGNDSEAALSPVASGPFTMFCLEVNGGRTRVSAAVSGSPLAQCAPRQRRGRPRPSAMTHRNIQTFGMSKCDALFSSRFCLWCHHSVHRSPAGAPGLDCCVPS